MPFFDEFHVRSFQENVFNLSPADLQGREVGELLVEQNLVLSNKLIKVE